ncbi:hypothetical protein ES332_A13G085000v1 [Gossypium tomentosum]|uniref:Uncharacterized protein n=1 Tax=Gossypium tomentosum TaxID=34277 RepID=A0A5D2MJK6_GOSTO|nr:hypothetical protein ES332_A13G085000v1 [Gossypium tomentosum]
MYCLRPLNINHEFFPCIFIYIWMTTLTSMVFAYPLSFICISKTFIDQNNIVCKIKFTVASRPPSWL